MATPSMEMVVRQAVLSEMALTNRDYDARRDESRRVVDDLVRFHTSGLVRAKRQGRAASLAIAGIAALVALLRTLGLHTVEVPDAAGDRSEEAWISPTARIVLFGILAASSAMIALLAWRASARATWMESAIEDAASTLDDKNNYLRALAELRRHGRLGEAWNHDDLRTAVQDWAETDLTRRRSLRLIAAPVVALVRARAEPEPIPLRNLAAICGPPEFANLFIAKGLERQLLQEERITGPHGPEFRYRMR